VAAGLMIRGFARIAQPGGRGFNPDNVLTMHLLLNEKRYATPERISDFYKQAIEKVAEIPGAESLVGFEYIPDGRSWSTADVNIEGRPAPGPGEDQSVSLQTVTPGFFKTLSVPVLDGRDFTLMDDAGKQGVAIVSAQFVRQYFPDENPLGRRIKVAERS